MYRASKKRQLLYQQPLKWWCLSRAVVWRHYAAFQRLQSQTHGLYWSRINWQSDTQGSAGEISWICQSQSSGKKSELVRDVASRIISDTVIGLVLVYAVKNQINLYLFLKKTKLFNVCLVINGFMMAHDLNLTVEHQATLWLERNSMCFVVFRQHCNM